MGFKQHWNSRLTSQPCLKELTIYSGNYLDISEQEELNQEAEIVLQDFWVAFNKYIPRLVRLASERTIPRIAGQNCHFRMSSRDLLIRVVQMLGWFINLKGTILALEEAD